MGNLHRVMVIADGDNAFMAAHNFNRKIDWHKVRDYLADPKEGRELIEMVIYMGLPPGQTHLKSKQRWQAGVAGEAGRQGRKEKCW